nr:hypothetical protein [Tanacetum cinerariifolium]
MFATVSLVYKPEPCYNQSFSDNAYTHDSPGVTPLIDHHCCYKCGDSLNDFFCHQCTCEFCGNGAHDGYNCPSHVPLIQTLPSFPQQYPCCEDCRAIAITFDLPTGEPEDSLIIRGEHLNAILETESDEFIKSSVENLISNPSESEDLSDNISKEIYLNPLFDEEIISIKIDPHHFNAESDLIESLLNHDSSIISSSSKIDSLLGEFTGELTLLKSIPSGVDETDYDPEEEIRLIKKLLYDNSSPHPPKEFISENSDATIESSSPSPILIEDSDSLMEEINLSFTPNDSIPSGIEKDDYDSEGDILTLEELLSNSSVGDTSEHDVPMPRLLPTQPTLVSNKMKSHHLLSHRGFKAFSFILNAR